MASSVWIPLMVLLGFSGGAGGKDPTCQCRRRRRLGFDPWVGKIPWRREWQPNPVFLPSPMDRGAWWVAKSQTWLKWLHACMVLLMGPPSWLGTWRWEILDSCCFYLKHSTVLPVLFIMLSNHIQSEAFVSRYYTSALEDGNCDISLGYPRTGVYDSKCYWVCIRKRQYSLQSPTLWGRDVSLWRGKIGHVTTEGRASIEAKVYKHNPVPYCYTIAIAMGHCPLLVARLSTSSLFWAI